MTVECSKTDSRLFSWERAGWFVAINRNKQLLVYQSFHTVAAADYHLLCCAVLCSFVSGESQAQKLRAESTSVE